MTTSFAFVFPGQGSQTVGMLADVAQQFPEVNDTFKSASGILGYDMQKLIFNGPEEQLNQTEFTQPALLAAGIAVWRIIQSRSDQTPAAVAGHSLGEYTALVAANAIDFENAIKLVAARGRFMQEAMTGQQGAMAAIIGLPDETVQSMCREISAEMGLVLSPANYNSVGQTVIAGHTPAIERALVVAKEKGAKMAVIIPVSVPCHCDLVRPAAEKLAAVLNDMPFKTPIIPVLNNVDVKYYQQAADIRDGLTRQLYSPVRWVETIQTFQQKQIQQITECGPGKVLSGLNKRIDKSLQLQSLCDLASIENYLTTVNERNAT